MALEGVEHMITPERFLMVHDGKLYELVRSEVGCGGCELYSSQSPDTCIKADVCRAAADLLFGHKAYRHWRLVCTRGY